MKVEEFISKAEYIMAPKPVVEGYDYRVATLRYVKQVDLWRVQTACSKLDEGDFSARPMLDLFIKFCLPAKVQNDIKDLMYSECELTYRQKIDVIIAYGV